MKTFPNLLAGLAILGLLACGGATSVQPSNPQFATFKRLQVFPTTGQPEFGVFVRDDLSSWQKTTLEVRQLGTTPCRGVSASLNLDPRVSLREIPGSGEELQADPLPGLRTLNKTLGTTRHLAVAVERGSTPRTARGVLVRLTLRLSSLSVAAGQFNLPTVTIHGADGKPLSSPLPLGLAQVVDYQGSNVTSQPD